MHNQSNTKRICFVTTVPITLLTFVRPQAEYLMRNGWDVTWICAEDEEISQDIPYGVRFIPIQFKRGFDFIGGPAAIVKLYRLFKRERFDLVQYSTPNAAFYTSTAAWLARIPVRLYAQWGIRYVGFEGLLRQMCKLLEHWCCHCSTVIQPDSLSNLEFSITEGLYPRNKGRVIWNGSACGVDLQHFDIVHKTGWRTEYRRKTGLSPDHQVIGFVGSIRRDKGCNELIAACRSFFSDMPEARLLLIGDKQFYDTIDKDLRNWVASSSQVIHIPPNNEIPQYMACMDIFSLPSYREGFGLVIAEAEAMGVPVVASEVPGPIDAMRHQETGLIVPVKNAQALAVALQALLNDTALRLAFGVAAAAFVRDSFEQNEFLRRVLEDKEGLLSHKSFKQHEEDSGILPTGSGKSHSTSGESEKRSTRFLFVTRVPITAVRFILPLANKLRERGNYVEFAFGPGEGLQELEDSGFSFTILTMNKKSRSAKNAGVVLELRQVIKNGRYDVVHTYSPIIGVYGRLAACKTETPVVVHSVIGSLLASGVPLSHRIMYLASELATSRLVDLFITLNDADAHDMVKYRLASAEKVASLKYEYGVDLREFKPESIDKDHLDMVRKQHGLEKGIPVIGFIGRMIGAKGILDLFEAYLQIRNNGVMSKLVYLGDVLSTDKDQTSISHLKGLVKKAGFESDVVFLGFQKDVPFYISLMDVVVLPSHHEGFPRIPVEAGAMGKPSVTTATAGAEVAINEGETGFIVPIKDPCRLGEALQKIITDPILAHTMGTNARQRVVDLFDQNKIVDQQVQIYEDYFRRNEKTKSFQV
jgi:glycosyltransferase involved in cell wall biosynthesis